MRDEITAVLLMVFGVLGIVGGVLGKEFHAADIITLQAYKQKVTTWLGRLVFIIVGVGLVGIGVKMLLGAE